MAELPYNLKDGALSFNGNCEECRPYCASHCCKAFSINLLAEEAVTGKYQMQYENYPGNQSYYFFCLKKIRVPWSQYEVCCYLDEDYKCKIYDNRPIACRSFTCQYKSIYFMQFRGFVDFGKIRQQIKNGETKTPEVIDGQPPMESIGVIWASLGDFRTIESSLRTKMEGWDDNAAFNTIKGELQFYINEMSESAHSIENEITVSMINSEKQKFKKIQMELSKEQQPKDDEKKD